MRLLYNCYVYGCEDIAEDGAVLCNDGRIISRGRKTDYQNIDCPSSDLSGGYLAPAFLDSHCHFLGCIDNRLSVDLSGASDFGEVKKRISKAAAAPVELIRAVNFEDEMCTSIMEAEEDIEKSFADIPVIIVNTSGHGGFINGCARKKYGIESQKTHLTEKEFTDAQAKLPMPAFEELLCAARKTEKEFLSLGSATVQEGYIERSTLPVCLKLYGALDTSLDIVGYISPFDFTDSAENERLFSGYLCKGKKSGCGFRLGGYKIIIDGSPQMRTAYMSREYSGGGRGELSLSAEKIDYAVQRAVYERRQLLAHCNGDAAVEQFVAATERAAAKGADVASLRFVIVHAFLMPEKLMERAARLGMIASFFPAHTEKFSAVHTRNLGAERASAMAPVGSAIKKRLLYTLHTDAPVTSPDLLHAVLCACRRTGKDGRVIGARERISVREGLAGICENAAFQYFEEKEKGSTAPGALSRFALLDRNPLTCGVANIGKINVTYIEAY